MSQAQSIRAKIALIARKQQVPFERVFTSFLLERAVVRLVSHSELSKHLCFKGGFVSLREYGSPRFTKDIDASVISLPEDKLITKVKDTMDVRIEDGVSFVFYSQSSIKGQTDYHGINFKYRVSLDAVNQHFEQAQIIDIDIGLGDKIVPKPRRVSLKPILGDQPISWYVYPIETIIAEKLHSLMALREISSRSKDIFDLVNFLPKVNQGDLQGAIQTTFKQRKTEIPFSFVSDLRTLNTTILEKGWKSSAGYIKEVGTFAETFEKLLSFLAEMDL